MDNLKIKEEIVPNINDDKNFIENNMNKIEKDILYSELIENISDDVIYNCSSCRMQIEIIDGEKGYCEHCESIVFIEKA